MVVHLGGGQWVVVDSCLVPGGEPAPLSYLSSIGVDVVSSVGLVVATHWHDDHIRGLGKVVGACERAVFACSAALRPVEFLTLVQAYDRRSMMSNTGVSEFGEILQTLRSRNPVPLRQPRWAIADRHIWRSGDADIHALSPSDLGVEKAKLALARLLPEVGTGKGRVPDPRPNETAVVLWIESGGACLLLGSDLEESGSQAEGWSAIVNSDTRPGGVASAFKVAHHGSETADLDRTWTELLEAGPVSVLTPFVRGNVRLPTPEDARRICERSGRAFATARPQVRQRKRAQPVEKMIKSVVSRIQEVPYCTGQVRLRRKIRPGAGEAVVWEVDLLGDALPLEQLREAG